MAEALDVARFFLVLADASREDGEALTHLKMQKLLYYSQGFHLALCDTSRSHFGGKCFAADSECDSSSGWTGFMDIWRR